MSFSHSFYLRQTAIKKNREKAFTLRKTEEEKEFKREENTRNIQQVSETLGFTIQIEKIAFEQEGSRF